MAYRILGILLALAGLVFTSSSKEPKVLLSGLGLTVIGVLLMCGIVDLVAIVRHELRGQRFELSAEGQIERAQVTGTYVNESPMVILSVFFRDNSTVERHVQTKKVIPLTELSHYAQGVPVLVRYRPDDLAREVLVQSLPVAAGDAGRQGAFPDR